LSIVGEAASIFGVRWERRTVFVSEHCSLRFRKNFDSAKTWIQALPGERNSGMATGRGKLVRYGRNLTCDFRRGWVASLAIVLTALLLAPPLHADYCGPINQGQARPASPDLPMAAQLSISNALGRDQQEYHAILRNGGASMANPGSALSADFTSKLVEFQVGGDRWGMALSAALAMMAICGPCVQQRPRPAPIASSTGEAR